jgi:hypothetical protein
MDSRFRGNDVWRLAKAFLMFRMQIGITKPQNTWRTLQDYSVQNKNPAEAGPG